MSWKRWRVSIVDGGGFSVPRVALQVTKTQYYPIESNENFLASCLAVARAAS